MEHADPDPGGKNAENAPKTWKDFFLKITLNLNNLNLRFISSNQIL